MENSLFNYCAIKTVLDLTLLYNYYISPYLITQKKIGISQVDTTWQLLATK